MSSETIEISSYMDVNTQGDCSTLLILAHRVIFSAQSYFSLKAIASFAKILMLVLLHLYLVHSIPSDNCRRI